MRGSDIASEMGGRWKTTWPIQREASSKLKFKVQLYVNGTDTSDWVRYIYSDRSHVIRLGTCDLGCAVEWGVDRSGIERFRLLIGG